MFSVSRSMKCLLVAGAASLVLSAATASGVPIPIPESWDFGTGVGKDTAAAFTPSGGGTWSLAADSYNYATTSSLAVFTSTAEFADLGGNNFTITATATNTGITRPRDQGWFDQFGIIAAGDALGNDGFAAVFRYGGTTTASIRFYNDGFNAGTVTEQNWTGSQAAAAVYSMTLVGIYVGSDLNLSFTVVDENDHSQTINHTLAAASYSGDFAGFGGRAQQRTVVFNDFAVVPEPALLSLLGLGALAMLRRRRVG
jgi:hypothetical protein